MSTTQTAVDLKSEALFSTLATMLDASGQRPAAELLTRAKLSLQHWEHDNWEGGQDFFCIHAEIPADDYARLSQDTVRQLEVLIGKTAGAIEFEDRCWATQCRIRPRVMTNESWRSDFHPGGRPSVSNQGLVRSDNPAPLVHDGLRFRSRSEIRVYEALKGAGVLFSPLPVFVNGRERGGRIEPDFFVFYRGAPLCIEVDGPAHTESPAAAQARTRLLSLENIDVIHIDASECATDEGARATVRKILADFARKRGH